jgi:hypothetical protein
VTRRGFVRIVLCVLALFAAGGASWKIYAARELYHLEDRENDPNRVEAHGIAGIHVSLTTPVPFTHRVVDGTALPNGRKPKVIIDPDGHGSVIGAQDGPNGFALYRPGRAPAIINPYTGGIGAEDAQAADLDGNGRPDIVVGGLDNMTFVLYNPSPRRCPDVYRCTWTKGVIDGTRASHDVVVGDVDRDGAADVVTEAGVYFNRARGRAWQFAWRDVIPRDGEGTSIGDFAGDGILDIVAPYRSGTKVAVFENPLHRHGDPAHDAWRPKIVDPHPPFTGNMATAVADINRDGRNDIVLAPMYGGGGLAWYENPSPRAGAWVRHEIDPTINFVHQGSLQVATFGKHDGPDIAFAEQDQSPTRRVGVFYNVAGDGTRWRLQVLSTNGGHNIRVGPLGRDRRLSIVSARHGYLGGYNPLDAWEASR